MVVHPKTAGWVSVMEYTDKRTFLISTFACSIIIHTLFSSPEPKAPRWAISIPMTPASVVRPSSVRRPSVVRPSSVVRQHFQTSSSLKPLGQLNWNFTWRLLRMGELKFVQMVLVTWPKWPPCPYMVKTLKKSSSPEPEGQWPWDLVCSIRDVGPTKFVQMMILGWPWPT